MAPSTLVVVAELYVDELWNDFVTAVAVGDRPQAVNTLDAIEREVRSLRQLLSTHKEVRISGDQLVEDSGEGPVPA